MDYNDSDQAFLKQQIKGTKHEMTYAGALSFLRRKYSRDLDGIDLVRKVEPLRNHRSFRRVSARILCCHLKNVRHISLAD